MTKQERLKQESFVSGIKTATAEIRQLLKPYCDFVSSQSTDKLVDEIVQKLNEMEKRYEGNNDQNNTSKSKRMG